MSTPPPPPIPSAPATPDERVGRGLAFSLLVIPGGVIAAAAVFGVLQGVPIFLTALLGGAVVIAAQALYRRGSGAPPREGLPGVILIAVAAVIPTMITAIVASVYGGFVAVGGRGGLLGDAFLTTLVTRITRDPTDFIVMIVLLAFGFVIAFFSKEARLARRAAGVADDARSAPASAPMPPPPPPGAMPVAPMPQATAVTPAPPPAPPMRPATAVPPAVPPTPAPAPPVPPAGPEQVRPAG